MREEKYKNIGEEIDVIFEDDTTEDVIKRESDKREKIMLEANKKIDEQERILKDYISKAKKYDSLYKKCQMLKKELEKDNVDPNDALPDINKLKREISLLKKDNISLDKSLSKVDSILKSVLLHYGIDEISKVTGISSKKLKEYLTEIS